MVLIEHWSFTPCAPEPQLDPHQHRGHPVQIFLLNGSTRYSGSNPPQHALCEIHPHRLPAVP